MKVINHTLGVCATNCYIVVNEKSNEALIIDPGEKAKFFLPHLQKLDVTPVAILLTHGHFDHAGAVAELASQYNIPVMAHEAEKSTLEDSNINLSGPFLGHPVSYHVDEFLRDEQELDLAGFHIRVLHTPGHTAGGCCFYFSYENCVFTGDTLFAESVGRTDFPGGSMSTIVNSIKTKLMVLPDATVVYPGHNEPTTIDNERMYNPFL